MSERDRTILGELALPMARVAHVLHVTRQSLHEGIVNPKRHWLDAARLKELLATLSGSGSGEEREAANRLGEIVVQLSSKFSLGEKLQADQIRGVADKYLIFSTKPLELSEAGYIEMMESRVFGYARLVVYFVPPEGIAKRLSDVLKPYFRSKTKKSSKTKTAIFIIESNAVPMMPHLAIVNSRDGWNGIAIGLSGDLGSRMLISDQLVTDILNTLKIAGMDAHGDPHSFFPDAEAQVEHDGIYFRNYRL